MRGQQSSVNFHSQYSVPQWPTAHTTCTPCCMPRAPPSSPPGSLHCTSRGQSSSDECVSYVSATGRAHTLALSFRTLKWAFCTLATEITTRAFVVVARQQELMVFPSRARNISRPAPVFIVGQCVSEAPRTEPWNICVKMKARHPVTKIHTCMTRHAIGMHAILKWARKRVAYISAPR